MRLGGAIDLRSGRRAAHRRDDLLHRDAAAPKRRRARLLAHADAGRCRCGDGGGTDGGRPIGPARPGDAGQDDADRLDPPCLCGGRKGKAGRRRGQSVHGGRCARFRRAADDRLRHGEARGRARHNDLGRDARRARGFRRAAVRAVGLRGDRAPRGARRECQPRRLRRRLRPRARGETRGAEDRPREAPRRLAGGRRPSRARPPRRALALRTAGKRAADLPSRG